jgi:hypothetical protein
MLGQQNPTKRLVVKVAASQDLLPEAVLIFLFLMT